MAQLTFDTKLCGATNGFLFSTAFGYLHTYVWGKSDKVRSVWLKMWLRDEWSYKARAESRIFYDKIISLG